MHKDMKRNRMSFKEAFKQQITFCICGLFIIIGAGYSLYPVNTTYKTAVFSAFVLLISSLSFFWIRRATNQVLCSSCESNLYHLIEGSGPVKLEINFCPVCGTNLNA